MFPDWAKEALAQLSFLTGTGKDIPIVSKFNGDDSCLLIVYPDETHKTILKQLTAKGIEVLGSVADAIGNWGATIVRSRDMQFVQEVVTGIRREHMDLNPRPTPSPQ
jgi:hypothetical protein